MNVILSKTAEELGVQAAKCTKALIEAAIAEKGVARVVFSTGASQFTTFDALLKMDIDWSKVEMFHLDEYVDLPESHIASFRKYLKERFINKVNLKSTCLVNGENDLDAELARLEKELRSAPIDIGLIGIGENAHIAFNDPPADIETKAAYKVVTLNDTCKQQQVREGWFATVDDVPKYAISMTVYEILNIKHIISAVPNAVKATAVKNTLTAPVSNMIPGTFLRDHADFNLFIDANSGALLTEEEKAQFCTNV